jgi:putative flippase GtrA
VLNATILEVLVTRLGFAYLLGQGVALVATTCWNYVAQKSWVFWARPTPQD